MANSSDSPRPTSFFEPGARYPEQTKLAYEEGFVGEMRGYYPPAHWKPSSSKQGYTRSLLKEGDKLHGGLDIYAPIFPFPYEIPVFAFVNCTAWGRSNARQPNANGDRLQLTATRLNLGEDYTLAHLNRFHGRIDPTQETKAGTRVGYVGYSGNAGAPNGDPPKPHSAMKIDTGHVHFQLGFTQQGEKDPNGLDKEKLKQPSDPLKPLGWAARFDKGSPLHANRSHKEFAANYARAETPVPWRQSGYLFSGQGNVWVTNPKSSLWTLPSPHDLIEFNNKKLLELTEKAYALAAKRLKEPNPKDKVPPAAWDPHERCAARFLADLRAILERTKEMRAEAAAFAAAGNSPIDRATHLMRFLFAGSLLLHALLGGWAIAKAAAGTADRADKVDPPKDVLHGEAPECGIGLWGQSWALALDHGQAALHRTNLRHKVADGAGSKIVPRAEKTWSISFGAGTEWHAILDEAIFPLSPALPLPGLGKRLVDLGRELAGALERLATVAAANVNGLNGDHKKVDPVSLVAIDLAIALFTKPPLTEVGGTALLDRIDAFCTDCLTPTQDGYKADAKAQILLIMRRLAETGQQACALAVEALGADFAMPPHKPSVTRLSLRQLYPPGDYPEPAETPKPV
ncbi:hypothetical protein [Xanthobacter autotrophicus]|uniref:hypothetical protein n=1 Tax=Xanthobacter autotrophicus TaxID=280 RepID=UPI0037296119